MIGSRDGSWLFVEAKYKNPVRESWGREYIRNEGLYQAFTYATALDAPAVLVYPKVDRDVDIEFGTGLHRARIVAVPLHASIGEIRWTLADMVGVSSERNSDRT